jgi:serine/threonine protein kinase
MKDTFTVQGHEIQVTNLIPGKKLPEGANSVVFLAYDKLLERTVVVKFWVKKKPSDLRDKLTQATAEAKKIAQLDHPNIVKVYSADIVDNTFYLVMEHVIGDTLRQVLKKESVPFNERLSYWRDIHSAISYAHGSCIYHGDLHPGNVIISANAARVIDFGTSRFCGVTTPAKSRETSVIVELNGKLFPEVTGMFPLVSDIDYSLVPELTLYLCDARIELYASLEKLKRYLTAKDIDDLRIRTEIFALAVFVSKFPFFDIKTVHKTLRKIGLSLSYSKIFLNSASSITALHIRRGDVRSVHDSEFERPTIALYLQELVKLQAAARVRLLKILSYSHSDFVKDVT